MPYLNEWAALEENYSTSLSGVINALCNLSLRLPVNGGVKVRYDVEFPYITIYLGKVIGILYEQ